MDYKYDWKPHASREKTERDYLINVDYVVTCCDTYLEALLKKYPFLGAEQLMHISVG